MSSAVNLDGEPPLNRAMCLKVASATGLSLGQVATVASYVRREMVESGWASPDTEESGGSPEKS